MKAMILAAGLGTRLRPLTDKRPKALVPVVNRPIMGRIIEYLKGHGVSRIIVNAHHHYRQILNYLDGGRPFGLKIEVRVEPEILGTGGGIRNTADFWDDEPFIVINSDVLTNIHLGRAYEHHRRSERLATLILHDWGPYNKISTDPHGDIARIPHSYVSRGLAFTGIHILEPALLSHISGTGFSDITDCYRDLILSGKPINSYVSEGHYWYDIGDRAGYVRANRELSERPFDTGPGCRVDPSAGLEEWVVVGQDSRIEKNARVRRSILWDHVTVREGVRVLDSIVTSSLDVKHDLVDEIL